jgi:hypothetical protein
VGGGRLDGDDGGYLSPAHLLRSDTPRAIRDGVFREALGNGRGSILVGGEVGGDGLWQIESDGSSLQVRNTGTLAPCVSWTPTGTDRDNSASRFSGQVQGPAHVLAFQQTPKPRDLIRGLEKGVSAKDVRVLSLDDILDLTDRCGRDVADALDVLKDEQEMVGIDVAGCDEAPGLLGAATGVVLVMDHILGRRVSEVSTAGTASKS